MKITITPISSPPSAPLAGVDAGRSAPPVAPPPVQPANEPRNGRLNEYLLAPEGFSPSTALQGLAPYIRTVSVGRTTDRR